MPCAVRARGTRTITAIPPFTGTMPPLPAFNDATDNDPCGRAIVTTANGVSYAADSLCLSHLMFKYGQKTIGPPYT